MTLSGARLDGRAPNSFNGETIMTPQEAGASLRDDPSFSAMSAEEREEEAAILLGTDDPLEIALAIEEAMSAPRIVVTAKAGRDEGCRLETPCASPRLAGNGKCMDCGAMRKPAEAPQIVVERVEPVKVPHKPEKAKLNLRSGAVAVRPAGATVQSEDFLSRYKALTGETDRMISIMLGVSRATAQAWISGRIPERMTAEQTGKLLADMVERVTLLRELAVDMEAAVAAS